ncbi:MAG TPA: L-lactate dehydrogenase [Candidatus Scatovivens faecipullorum]|nr:L-lactate dehydrogenase [Candidatus Scatovivens faecipullorum]
MIGKRKVVLVGTGFVGMSMAYAILSQGTSSGVNELVLIDVLKDKAIGEAMDLAHGLPCSSSHMKIKAGDYDECEDADIVVITAGLNQKPGQTRLELSEANAKIMKDITIQVVNNGFKGIFLVASNPVDLMTKVVQEVSKFPTGRVIGSGTALDTARLRYMVGEYLNVSNKNVHAYIMGEHGDSSFVPWEHAYVGCKKITDILADAGKELSDLDKIYVEVRDAAYEIINRKKATYYGIGLGLARIVKNIMNDTNEILTVSAYLNGEYGHKDIYVGVPAIINSNGARELLELELNKQNKEKLDNSCKILSENMNNIRKVLNNK